MLTHLKIKNFWTCFSSLLFMSHFTNIRMTTSYNSTVSIIAHYLRLFYLVLFSDIFHGSRNIKLNIYFVFTIWQSNPNWPLKLYSNCNTTPMKGWYQKGTMGPVPMVTTVQSYTADIYICIMGASLITIVFPALALGPPPCGNGRGHGGLFVHLWEHEAGVDTVNYWGGHLWEHEDIELPSILGCPLASRLWDHGIAWTGVRVRTVTLGLLHNHHLLQFQTLFSTRDWVKVFGSSLISSCFILSCNISFCME